MSDLCNSSRAWPYMHKLAKILLVSFLVFLASCSEKTLGWNQKLTVIVETPTGEVSASSVSRVNKINKSGFLMPREAAGVSSELQGEAIALEVAPGQYLFVLLEGNDFLMQQTFPDLRNRDDKFHNWVHRYKNHTDVGVVPPEHYPQMVTFADVKDPATVQSVDPTRLDLSFGEGVWIKRITIQVTDEQLTEGELVQVLDWWPTYRGGPLNEMKQLRAPHPGPRGWEGVSPRLFWSLDRRLQFNKEYQ